MGRKQEPASLSFDFDNKPEEPDGLRFDFENKPDDPVKNRYLKKFLKRHRLKHPEFLKTPAMEAPKKQVRSA